MMVHYPKLYNMAHLALNVLLLPKDLTIIFISICFATDYCDVLSTVITS